MVSDESVIQFDRAGTCAPFSSRTLQMPMIWLY